MSIINSFTKARKYHVINCWHLNEHESAAMWRLYLKSNEGIAIRSTFGRLCDSFISDEHEVFVGKVKYMDYNNEIINFGNSLLPFLRKRKSFQHENEVRAIVWKPNLKDETLDLLEETITHGIKIPVDLETLIESVYIAPHSPSWLLKTIEGTLYRYNINCKVVVSRLYDAPIY